MADKIGVLGEQTGLTVATHTAYTVPTGKAAKCRIMYRGAAGSNSTLTITVNNVNVMTSAALTDTYYIHSHKDQISSGGVAAAPDGLTVAKTVAPGPQEYYLSAGDTITYTIGTAAFTAMNMQIVGVEIDV